jgi:hypothetical protein
MNRLMGSRLGLAIAPDGRDQLSSPSSGGRERLRCSPSFDRWYQAGERAPETKNACKRENPVRWRYDSPAERIVECSFQPRAENRANRSGSNGIHDLLVHPLFIFSVLNDGPLIGVTTHDLEVLDAALMADNSHRRNSTGGRISRNRILHLLKAMLNWAVAKGYRSETPFVSQRLRAAMEMLRHDPDGREFGPEAFVFGTETGKKIKCVKTLGGWPVAARELMG